MTALMNQRRPHAADGMTLTVECGDGAAMFIVSAQDDPAMEWVLRYGNAEAIRHNVASIVASYHYLVAELSIKEATRRLRLMRKAYLADVAARRRTASESPATERLEK